MIAPTPPVGGAFTAVEHTLLCCILTVRYASVTARDFNYQAKARSWDALAGDPHILSEARLENVAARELLADSTGTTGQGYLPKGWQWRTRWNDVDKNIANLASFPMYRAPTGKNRSSATVFDAFRSTTLGDMVIDLDISQISRLPFDGGEQLGTGFRVGNLEPDRMV